MSARLGRLLSHLEPARCSAEEPYDEQWKEYREKGLKAARELGNRGPPRFDDHGCLTQDILEAYRRTGFYIFENVVSQEEIKEIEAEFDALLDRAPAYKGSPTDKHGRPLRFPSGVAGDAAYFVMHKPKTDNLSFDKTSGSEDSAVGLISHPLHMMDSALRVAGHPSILKIIASFNGPDFIPMNESIWHKGAGEGAPTAWHQDGRTHWTPEGVALEQPDGTGKTHGLNLSVSFATATPESCLWVVPGSHRSWRLVKGGNFPHISERIEGAVPAVMNPGDCCMASRSSLHGSYPNRSDSRRVTMVLSFHNRASAMGTETTNVHAFKSPGPEKRVKYNEDYILRRARMIPLAIDARRQKYPNEAPYVYKGAYLGHAKWDDQARAEISKEGDEYWQRNITL